LGLVTAFVSAGPHGRAMTVCVFPVVECCGAGFSSAEWLRSRRIGQAASRGWEMVHRKRPARRGEIGADGSGTVLRVGLRLGRVG